MKVSNRYLLKEILQIELFFSRLYKLFCVSPLGLMDEKTPINEL